jgi:hypothetical protein
MKSRNTTWELEDQQKIKKRGFSDLVELGVSHFKNLFFKKEHESTTDMFLLLRLFLKMLVQDDNKEFNKEIIVDELHGVLGTFKRDKILGLDGWTIDFYQEFFDTIGKDLVFFLEEIRKEGKLKLAFNTTFLALIPKTDLPRLL